MSEDQSSSNHLELTADIVSAYVSNNSVPSADLSGLIHAVHASLRQATAGSAEAPVEPAKEPAVPVRKSVTNDFITCLEDGKKFKSLKRHLSAAYGMTPDAYRTKWGLPRDYPMVAPVYSAQRSKLARDIGLGARAAAKSVAPGAKVTDVPTKNARRGRPRKAA